MNWTSEIQAVLQSHRAAADWSPADIADVVEEWSQHAEAIWAQARADGASDAEAAAQVRSRIQAWSAELVTQPRRRHTTPVVPPPPATAGWSGWWQDVRYGWRVLRRQRGFAAVAVLTTALAIGATTTLFTVADGVLARPLPYPSADRLIRLSETREGATRTLPSIITHVTYQTWRVAPTTIESIAGFRSHTATLPGDGKSAARRVAGAQVTASFFEVLGVRPLRGSVFTEADEAPGRPGVVVISEPFWRDRFGADPAVIGQTLELDETPYQVVGVMPSGVALPGPDTRFWIPMSVPSAEPPADGSTRIALFAAIARLRPGATVEQASAEASSRAQAGPPVGMVDTAVFGSQGARLVSAVSLKDFLTGEVRPAILVFLAAVGLLFLTAVANISSLQLAKATGRRRELAIRSALGAGTGRLARQLLIESALLGVAGGIGGLVLTFLLHGALPSLLPADFPRVSDVVIDARTLLFAGFVSVCAGLLFGWLPVLHVRRVRLVDALSEDNQAPVGLSLRTSVGRLRAGIMVGQVAAATVLLVGALLLGRSFSALWNADRGYEVTNVLTARVAMPDPAFSDQTRADRMRALIDRSQALPGVTRAGFSTVIPMSNAMSLAGFTLPPRADDPNPIQAQAAVLTVSPGFFDALGIEMAAGRSFTPADTASSDPVLVVNETFARTYLDGDALGKRLPLAAAADREESEVVGVIRDVQPSTRGEAPRPEVYYAFEQANALEFSEPTLLLRTTVDPLPLIPALRQMALEIDPRIAIDAPMTMEARLAAGLARPRLYAVLLSALSGLSLLIATVGVFGVLSYNVAQRRREIGVRAALGARPVQLMALTIRQGMAMTVVGSLLGLGLSVWLARFLEGLLWGVSARDVVSYAMVPLVLLVATAIACWVPARRAAHIDPLVAMRQR